MLAETLALFSHLPIENAYRHTSQIMNLYTICFKNMNQQNLEKRAKIAYQLKIMLKTNMKQYLEAGIQG